MKKVLYYLSPFVIIPFLAISMESIDNIGLIKLSPIIVFVVFIAVSAIIGNITPIKNKSDYVITAFMPFALFLTTFVIGFLEKDDLETRFNLDKAIEAAFQPLFLVLYVIMGLITLLASSKKIRIIKK